MRPYKGSWYEKLGERITILRQEQDPPMTMAQLGDRVGCSRFLISRIERGKTRRKIEVIGAIAATFGVTIDDLFQPKR